MKKTEIIQDKTFDVIKSAVNKMVDLIKPTYGPAENKVVISKDIYGNWPLVVDDGVQIARDFSCDDPRENAIVNVVRETAVKTNDRVGDGTTSSLIILQAIINEVDRMNKKDGQKIASELKDGLVQAKNKLLKSSKEISSKEDLKKVALTSFNDEKVADIIADIYYKIGKEGVITIDRSDTSETTSQMTKGIKIERGYVSPYMITNPQRMEAELNKPYILVTDYRLTEATDIIPIMEKLSKENKRELIIVCDNMESHALSTAVVNKIQNKFFLLAINTPESSDKRVYLEDLALMLGARFISEGKGDKMEEVEIADLGKADKFICKSSESVIVGPKGNKPNIKSIVDSLKIAIATQTNQRIREDLIKRYGLMTNKVAVIRVGALTENERKSLKYKVEDAVNAVKSAYNSGIVCGAGLALERIQTSSPILNRAMSAPAQQLRDNMGVDDAPDLSNIVTNYATGEKGSFLSVGVVDPTEVLIAGLESAVSIASILLTASGMIVEYKEDQKE